MNDGPTQPLPADEAPVGEPPQGGWRVPCCGCLLGLGLLLLTAGAGAFAYERYAEARIAATLSSLEADGLGLDGLQPEAPEPNAATLLQPALESMQALADQPEELSLACTPEFMIALREPRSNKASEYLPASAGSPSGPQTVDEAVALIVKRVSGLEAGVDEALAAPGCEFPLVWEDGFSMRTPHVLPLLVLIRSFGARAIRRQLDGETERAWEDVLRMVGLSECLRDPLLIVWLVRLASIGHVTSTVEALLQAGPPPEPALLDRVGDALEGLEAGRVQFTRALRGELRITLTFASSENRAETLAQVTGVKGVSTLPLFSDALVAHWQADLVETYARLIRASRLQPAQARAELATIEADVQRDGSMLATLLIPSVARSHQRGGWARARLRLARQALRVASAERVPERLGADVLPDPFDPAGGPLRWRQTGPRSGDLWSVGEDGVDDGGRFSETSERGKGWDVPFLLRLPE